MGALLFCVAHYFLGKETFSKIKSDKVLGNVARLQYRHCDTDFNIIFILSERKIQNLFHTSIAVAVTAAPQSFRAQLISNYMNDMRHINKRRTKTER